MKLGQNLGIALDGIKANKLRAALTMLGIIIGVAAVIVLMSIGSGTQAQVTSRISSLGSNLIFIRPGGAPQQGGVRQAQGSAATLTLEDADALGASDAVPGVLAVSSEVSSRSQVVFSNINTNTSIRGVDERYLGVRNYQLDEGDFFTKSQMDTRGLVAVLGASVTNTLFPEGGAVGRNIRINRTQFRVIGTLVSKGGSGAGLEDDVVMVPITTHMTRLSAQRSLKGGRSVGTINVQVENEKLVADAKDGLAAVLRDRHRITGDDD